ncbi:MAG: hypothetical protein EA351_13105 [Gemmatimonadales bacterium]|nr:MAG: hypothetical protein EA351_13105 [Gemmatimonadales bacterium]
MKRINFRLGALALLLSFGLMACGDDGPTQSGDTLTEAEAESMMGALTMAGGLGFFGMGFSADDASVMMETIPIDYTADCSGGGSVSISGEMTITGQGESISMNQTLTHNSCTETAPSDGRSWTFNGNPSINTQLSGSVSETSINFQGSQTGAMSWSSDGLSGSCQMNINYSVSGSATGGAVTVSISGSVCGQNISSTQTVSG